MSVPVRIGIDTNILVRVFVSDAPEQLQRVKALFASLGPDRRAHVARETLIELTWVLRQVYGLGRDDVSDAIEGLLDAEFIDIEDHDRVEIAISGYRNGGGDFADRMIAAANAAAGCAHTYTFDRKFAKLEGVELLE